MSNRKRKIVCLFLVTLCVPKVLTYGQHGDTLSNGKLIINGSGSTVTFQLKNGDSAWVNFSLGPNEQGTYYHATDISISTANRCTNEYTLKRGNRYRIHWDDQERCWDVIMLKPGN